MRSGIVCGLVVGGVLAGAALAAEQRPVEPGGKIGAMTVVRGHDYDADINVNSVCAAWIPRAGKYHRSCSVPKVPRLYIGVGWAAPPQKERELDNVWKQFRWRLSVDGRPVDLPRFGAYDDAGRYPNGKPAVFRNWKVILSGAPSGTHTIHYTWHIPSGSVDFTMEVTIGS